MKLRRSSEDQRGGSRTFLLELVKVRWRRASDNSEHLRRQQLALKVFCVRKFETTGSRKREGHQERQKLSTWRLSATGVNTMASLSHCVLSWQHFCRQIEPSQSLTFVSTLQAGLPPTQQAITTYSSIILQTSRQFQ